MGKRKATTKRKKTKAQKKNLQDNYVEDSSNENYNDNNDINNGYSYDTTDTRFITGFEFKHFGINGVNNDYEIVDNINLRKEEIRLKIPP
ncbi:unnamed protein product [Cunninghamella echinulata]